MVIQIWDDTLDELLDDYKINPKHFKDENYKAEIDKDLIGAIIKAIQELRKCGYQ